MLRKYYLSGLRVASIALLLSTILLAGASTTRAMEWVALDNDPPGSPAEVRVDPAASGPRMTKIDLIVHGFWRELRVGDDDRNYQHITVPGFGSTNQPGAPDLPAFKGRLGVPPGAARAVLTGVEVAAQSEFQNVLIWPQVFEETEPIEGNTPERFVLNEEIYGSSQPWPGVPANGAPEIDMFRGIVPTAQFRLLPFQYEPGERLLRVSNVTSYWFSHDGAPRELGPFTRDTAQVLKAILINWDAIDDLMVIGWWLYESDYLIVTPQDYLDTLSPFIDLKKAQGYFVTTRIVENIGSDCGLIRSAIADWYDDTPTNRDKYCLLVGDEDVIPLCTSPDLGTESYPGGVATEDLYGSVGGDDLDEEVYVGRLSVDDEEDLSQQLDRIIAYQTGFHFFQDYTQVGLVAHKEDAPGKYTEAHESVRTAYYSDPPSFQTYYGYLGALDSQVSAAIDAGLGVVAYRGHGSSSAWTSWNNAGQSYDDTDVSSLTNGIHPAVWSFACTNAKLSSEDCIAEKWMEKGDYGAISYYGSTVASYTSQNHELDRQMFQALYDEGLNIQAQTIEFGEERMASLADYHNAWMYLLLGDPSMRIRTSGPLGWEVVIPEEIIFDPEIPYELDLLLLGNDQVDPDVLFSVYKPAGARDEDEVFDNTYTDASGRATLLIQPQTEGMLYYALRGPGGEAVYDSIPVRAASTDAPSSMGADLRFWSEPSVMKAGGSLRLSRGLDREAEIRIYDASGRLVRDLALAPQRNSVAWDGRDSSGRAVPNGIYLARLGGSGEQRTTRLVVLR